MTYTHAQLMTVRNIQNSGPRSWWAAMQKAGRMAAVWGGRWVVYNVVLDGAEYWPVLGGSAVREVGHALEWDLVSTVGGDA